MTLPPMLLHCYEFICCCEHVFTALLASNGCIENTVSSIVACLFLATDMCLQNICLAKEALIHKFVDLISVLTCLTWLACFVDWRLSCG